MGSIPPMLDAVASQLPYETVSSNGYCGYGAGERYSWPVSLNIAR